MAINVLFVCLGNICRSPMAQAVFECMVDDAGLSGQFHIDSVGTSGWHIGELHHYGTQQVLHKNGMGTFRHRARQLSAEDYANPDTYIIAMDNSNIEQMRDRFGEHPNVHLLLDYFDDDRISEVPDPYYTGGFNGVFELVKRGCEGLLTAIREEHQI